MIVDIHSHLYPPGYLKLLGQLDKAYVWKQDSEGRTIIERNGSRLVTLTSKMSSIDEHIEDMGRYRVDVQVLSVTIPNVYIANPEGALKLAQSCNDYFVEIREKYSGRFMCFASIPLPYVEYAVTELERALVSKKMNGVILGTNINGMPLDSQEFRPFFKRANELGATIFLHPMIPPAIERMTEYGLGPMVGFIFDTTLAVARMVYSGMLDSYPNLRIILPHLGGAAPYLTGRWDLGWEAYAECKRKAPNRPSSSLRRLYYDVVSLHVPAITCALDTVGAGRLLFGTDYPHVIGNVSRTIDTVNELHVSESEKEGIFGTNALRILNNSKEYA